MATYELNLNNGGKWDIWLRNVEMIGQFIRKNQLQPVASEHLRDYHVAIATPTANQSVTPGDAVRWDGNIRGGNRLAHLHFKGEVYLLNAEQWAEFSAKVVSDCHARLANVKGISFDSLVQLAQAVESL